MAFMSRDSERNGLAAAVRKWGSGMTVNKFNADLPPDHAATIFWDKHRAGSLRGQILRKGADGFYDCVSSWDAPNDDAGKAKLIRKIKAWAVENGFEVIEKGGVA